MLRFITLSLLILVGLNSFGQNNQGANIYSDSLNNQISELTKIFSTKVSLKIDTAIFNKKLGNFYTSKKYEAFIVAIATSKTIAQAEEHFSNEISKNEYKLKEKGKFISDGKEVLFQKGTMKKDGKKYNTNIYALKGNETTTIFITGMYLPEYEKELDKVIEDAAKTARLDNLK